MPIAKDPFSAVVEVVPAAFFVAVWLIIGITTAVLVQNTAARAVALGYVGATLLLPTMIVLGDRRTTFGGLTLPLRQASRHRRHKRLKLNDTQPEPAAVHNGQRPRPKSRLR